MLSTMAFLPLFPKVPFKLISIMCLVLSTNMCTHRFPGFNCAGALARTIHRGNKANIWGERLNSFDERILNMQAIDYDNNDMENLKGESGAGHRSRLSTRSARDAKFNVQEIDYYIDNIDVELLPSKSYTKLEKNTVNLPQSPYLEPTYKGRTLEQNDIMSRYAELQIKPDNWPSSPNLEPKYYSKIFEEYDIIPGYANPESNSDKFPPKAPYQTPTHISQILEQNDIIPGCAKPKSKSDKLPQLPRQAATYIVKLFEQNDIMPDYAKAKSNSDKLLQISSQAPTYVARILEENDTTKNNDTVTDYSSEQINHVKISFINDTYILNQHINDLVDNHGSLKDEPKGESPIIPVMSSFGYGLQRIGKGIWSLLKLL